MNPKTWKALGATLLLAGCGGGGSSSAPSPSAFYVSAPDCAGVANIIAEDAPAPKDATFMRVQHIGDPGTTELAEEIAHTITWPVGDYTGFHPSSNAAQRGFRDVATPDPASAFQLECGSAGAFINTWQFSHQSALTGEGPSASIARDPAVPPAIFRAPGASLVMQADVDLRYVRYQQPHTGYGTAQLSFFYYAKDATTGALVAQLVALFDSRPPGVGGSATESVGNDGQVVFVESPLAAAQPDGSPVRFATVGSGSATEHTVDAWNEPLHFRAVVTYEQFSTLLARLRAGPLPNISPHPEDWHVVEFGVLAEVLPGTGDDHNVAMGTSVFNLQLSGI
jgi:hypothetical protein